MSNANFELVNDAIARNSGLVLSLPSAGLLRHHKSRFLAQAGGDDATAGAAFWVESVLAERPLVDELIGTSAPVGLSFKNGVQRVSFVCPLRRRDTAFRFNGDRTIEALLMPFPEQVKAVQRRQNYRARVRDDSSLSLRMWRISSHAYIGDRPMAAQELDAQLHDLSTGGMGVMLVGREGQPPKITCEDRLRIELTFKDEPMLLEARMRHPAGPPPPSGIIKAGIQFKALDNDLQGRQKLAMLTKIVGELQREEARRARLGL